MCVVVCVCVFACVCVCLHVCGVVWCTFRYTHACMYAFHLGRTLWCVWRFFLCVNGNGSFTHHSIDTFIITLPSICAGMSDEETAIFLANMGAEERTRFQTAMRHAADRADASDRASNFITASRGMQVSDTRACPRSMCSSMSSP